MEGYNKNLIQVQAIKNVSQLLRHITSVGNTVDTRVDVTQETLTCNTGNVCLCLCVWGGTTLISMHPYNTQTQSKNTLYRELKNEHET